MKSVVCKKAINFDLDTKALKRYYPQYARSEQKATVNITRESLKQRAIQVSQSSEKQPSKNKI